MTDTGQERATKAGPSRPPRMRPLRRALGAGAAVLLAALVLFLGGFGWFAGQVSQLRTPQDLPDADAIIVLTGGQFRLNAAIDLLKSGKGERLLISGVNPIARDAELRRAAGIDAALFSCCVDIDREALDTVGNAEESAKWVRRHAYDEVILVTNNYHMPRSMLEMRRLLAHTRLHPYPVVNSPIDGGGWMTKPDVVRVLFTEYVKYVGALARGALTEPAGARRLAVAGAG